MKTHHINLVLLSLVKLYVLYNLAAVMPLNSVAMPFEYQEMNSYTRFAEVESQCSSLLTSASDLSVDSSRDTRIKNELALTFADWKQEKGKSPLIPFDESDMPKNCSSSRSPLKVVNFDVGHVNPVQKWRNVVSLIGSMSIRITRNYGLRSTTQIRLENSFLSIIFEGVYVESKENGGERLLCMLGNTTVPNREVSNYGSSFSGPDCRNHRSLPSSLPGDKILLVLRYPQTFSLTRRIIRGEMRSLDNPGSQKYFDRVCISSQFDSQFDKDIKYEFSPKMLESITCYPSPYQEEMMDDGVINFDGREFCSSLNSLPERFDVVPHWKYRGRFTNHSNFGPFLFEEKISGDAWSYQNVKLILKNLKCEPNIDQVNNAAKVYAVFTLILDPENNDAEAMRNGPSSMTLSAEGTWNSRRGQLCMIGCLGTVEDMEACRSRISLFFPRILSIRQRSVITGSISGFNKDNVSYTPITFDLLLGPCIGKIDYKFYASSHLTYNYSMIEIAREFRERSKPSNLGTLIRKTILRYPGPGVKQLSGHTDVYAVAQSVQRHRTTGNVDKGLHLQPASLHDLFSDMQISTFGMPDKFSTERKSKILIELRLLSLGPLFGHRSSWDKNHEYLEGYKAIISNNVLLNVSLHLELHERPYPSKRVQNNISALFLEGLYDPLVGEMYLIGCRKVTAESPNLERGLDCLIHVKIQYSPISARWLKNPTATITINSKRSTDDPLFFCPLSMQTHSIRYPDHEGDVIFRKFVEGLLRILLASLVVVAVVCQLYYVDDNEDTISYISLVMLSIQILGYSLPLLSGAEILFKWKESPTYKHNSYNLQKYEQYFEVLDYIGKTLFLVILLLISRLFQKVLQSRNRHHAEVHSVSRKHVPSDKKVLFVTAALHNLAFFIFLVIHSMLAQPKTDKYIAEKFYRYNDHQVLPNWLFRLDEYIGLIQDSFLLPQIIGNFLWQTNVKPLSRVYYIGITMVRVLLHLYDYIRDPVSTPDFVINEIESTDMDTLSKFANTATIVIMITLAVVIHFQQKSNHDKSSYLLKSTQLPDQASKSTLSETLISKVTWRLKWFV